MNTKSKAVWRKAPRVPGYYWVAQSENDRGKRYYAPQLKRVAVAPNRRVLFYDVAWSRWIDAPMRALYCGPLQEPQLP